MTDDQIDQLVVPFEDGDPMPESDFEPGTSDYWKDVIRQVAEIELLPAEVDAIHARMVGRPLGPARRLRAALALEIVLALAERKSRAWVAEMLAIEVPR